MRLSPLLQAPSGEVLEAVRKLGLRMGFKRAPELDFKPAPGVTARGYLLTVEEEDL